jgi:hypothetical protein
VKWITDDVGTAPHGVGQRMRGSEWLRSTYLADSSFSWAHIVTLMIDAAVTALILPELLLIPRCPLATVFEQFPDVKAQEVVSADQAGAWSVSPPDLPSVCTNRTLTS